MADDDIDDNAPVHCDRHGEATATYVCGHLFRLPRQQWFGEVPAPDFPFPDAWCADCNAELLRAGGEWTEEAEECLDLKILCHHCYQDAMAQSVDTLEGPVLHVWQEALEAASEALQARQQALEQDWGISRFERWDHDQGQGTLTFSNAGTPCLVADIEFIGTLSRITGTWLWAWGNFHHQAPVVGRIGAVRGWGEERGFTPLTVPLWPAELVDAWEVAGVAAQVLGAQGVYRAPTQNGFLFMALMALRRVQ